MHANIHSEMLNLGQGARAAARELARLNPEVKDYALHAIADALDIRCEEVLEANARDLAIGRKAGLSEVLLDRLLITSERLVAFAEGVRAIAELPDPIEGRFDVRVLPNGLKIGKQRIPLGVIGVIYESRPNVTLDIAALCLKSGNACILRGGKEAVHSNKALAHLVQEAIAGAGVPPEAVQFVESTDRALLSEMLQMREHIDLLIPRGGAELVRFVAEHATMPTVTGGIGVVHTYVARTADFEKVVPIVYNAKVQRPTVCNALDCLLVDAEIAPRILPAIAAELGRDEVELRCDARAMSLIGPLQGVRVEAATPDDWGKEFLSLVLAIKVVDSMEEALVHIDDYGSGHTEAILTEDDSEAALFLDVVDAAAVIVNASTRFTDGSQFGLGAEVAISTNKLHARGPMGLRELTSYKWVVQGNGQVRS
jgi:glutamate-5-semialdehyde dehydrogenase